MSEDISFEIVSLPGVRRDGTDYDSPHHREAQWVRWQRDRPRKIGGYRAMSTTVAGIVRNIHVDSRNGFNRAHLFSSQAVEQLVFDTDGNGSAVFDRTPSGFVASELYAWQADSIFDVAGGSPLLVCAAAPDLSAIDSDAVGPVYSGNIENTTPLTAVSDGSPLTVSGGCVVLQPYLFLYGSNGLLKNSNANDISAGTGWTGGDSDEVNVAGTKIVKGLSLRGGGNSPAGIFWALDSLIRVSYVGGTALWRRDTVSAQTTILAKNGPVEYDGIYYWPGVDRFFMYNGVVQELPNDMNQNWFFDNLNFAQRNKVFGVKVPRFGEIWWHYPFGSNATECNAVIIYNVRSKTWYDTRLSRGSGYSAQVFRYPVLTGGENMLSTVKLTYTLVTGNFRIGDTVTGGTTMATGRIVRVMPTTLSVVDTVGTFLNTEAISTSTGTGTLTAAPVAQTIEPVWQHEFGVNKIHADEVLAIPSYYETRLFSFVSGGPTQYAPQGANKQVRLLRLEPDFVLTEPLTMTVTGRAFPQSADVASDEFAVTPTTEYVALREQRRIMSVRIESNVVNGNFEAGRNMTLIEPGDVRG